MIKVPFSGRATESLSDDALFERVAKDATRQRMLESWIGGKHDGSIYSVGALLEAFGPDDFSAITTDQVNVSALKGFNALNPDWPKLVTTTSTNDLVRDQVKIDVGSMARLAKVAPGERGNVSKPSDAKFSYPVSMYESELPLLFEFYNSANFADFLNKSKRMGTAARETIEDLVINQILLGVDDAGTFNARTFSFDDSAAKVKLYTAGNTLGASKALTEANLSAAIQLMAEKKDRDGQRVAWRPRYLVCGYQNQVAALKLLNSTATTAANENSGVVNIFENSLTPIITNFITDDKWFVVADPTVHDVIELAFFDGFREPVITQEPTLSTRELKWSVRLGMGGAPLNADSFVGANFAP